MIKHLLSVPTVGKSIAVFGFIYLSALAIAVPVANYFSFDGLSSLGWGALFFGAALVGEAWKAKGAVDQMKKSAFSLALGCFFALILVDFIFYGFGVDLINLKYFVNVLLQKAFQFAVLFLIFGTTLFIREGDARRR
jgi:hypothetical protein